MDISTAVNMAKGFEALGLICKSDWMTLKVFSKDHRDRLIKKVCDNAVRVGQGKRPV